MKRIALAVCLVSVTASAAQAEFSLAFTWGDIPLCTSGRPNTVGNPRFVLADVPEGTDSIDFHLTDLDAPGYPHGGGRVQTDGARAVPFGTFTYQSPCPPGGRHTYRWTATARQGSNVLGTATAERLYP